MNDFGESRELFQLRSGRVILDEDMSDKMFIIKQNHPEKADDTTSGFEWSEMGMANLFAMLYVEEARYCIEHKCWYTYSEGAWRRDEGAILVSEKIKDFVRLMILYCGEITDDDLRKNYMTFVNKMGDRRMRDRILKDATGELHISASQFDANPYLINCLNGTYDLSDYSFRPARWDDFLTMQTAFRHTVSRDVRCERWEKFIDEVTEGDKEKAVKREYDPDWREGRRRKEIPDFQIFLQKQKDGELTVDECCATLGISRRTWYNRVREVS